MKQAMETFYKEFYNELVFRQHQGILQEDTTVGKGVCSALCYEWVKQNLDGTYKVGDWTKEPAIFRKFAMPADSPIGRKFPHLTNVRIGMRKVQPGMALSQRIANLSMNTRGVEHNFDLLGSRDGRMVALVQKWKGMKGGSADVFEFLEKHNARFFQGYALIGLANAPGGGGHAVACQLAGSINRYYDPNFGEFKFTDSGRFAEAFHLSWALAEYTFRDLYLWNMYL
ncbi:MAG: hypothetical protein KDA28_08445 [Phycisphaerales bacterium]|nr:hypothetical protein [Phycisphaerales bacterium]